MNLGNLTILKVVEVCRGEFFHRESINTKGGLTLSSNYRLI